MKKKKVLTVLPDQKVMMKLIPPMKMIAPLS
jgi:hypothetical protein